tara:strand:- start:4948 stop:6174 length:1227 start_codon:yes stop_codon:yes gene_type:complete
MKINVDVIQLGDLELPEDEERKSIIEGIADSMAEQGQLQPITVRELNGEIQLVFGLKRLLAARQLKWDTIDVSKLEGGSDQTIKVKRIHENVKRENLVWYEEAELIQELHLLRQSEEGAASPQGGGRQKTGWGIRDTARELGIATGRTSEGITLATAVKVDPSLRNIKDRKTAIRLVRQRARRETQEDESILVPEGIDRDEIYLGDSAEVLRQMPPNVFNACLTDPPWLKFAPDKKLVKDDATDAVFKQVYRVLRMDSFLTLFVGFNDFVYYQNYLPRLGFQVQGTPCIWRTTKRLSRRSASGWQFARDVEFILIAIKGAPVLASSTQLSCHFSYDVVSPVSLRHPNEKPVKLLEDILGKITHPEATILDPFAGSFAVPVACLNQAMHYVAIERNPEFFKKGKERLGK